MAEKICSFKNEDNTNSLVFLVSYDEEKDECSLVFDLLIGDGLILEKIDQRVEITISKDGNTMNIRCAFLIIILKFFGCMAIEISPKILKCYKESKVNGGKLDWTKFKKCLKRNIDENILIMLFKCTTGFLIKNIPATSNG